MWPIGVRRGWAEAFGKATGDDAAEHSPQAETEVVDWSAAAAKVAERWEAQNIRTVAQKVYMRSKITTVNCSVLHFQPPHIRLHFLQRHIWQVSAT